MIVLEDVYKAGGDGLKIPKYSLNGVSLEFPSARRIAIFGRDSASMGMLLHLVAGSQTPDRGRVVANGARCSPIVNASGAPGAALSPKASVLANIKYFAGVRGVDFHRLTEIVAASCDVRSRLEQPVNALERPLRRAVEAAIVGALPFEYYLIDRFQTLEPSFRWRLRLAAEARKASLIFTTTDLETALRFGQIGIVCVGSTAREFADIRHGVEAFERQSLAN